ncbi:hypothetical protein RFM68_31135 [Mesorhizobium sp. MSK_1335]|uniref:Uncharacterized protein n=1 Tax=Mesorhizobium montanum TaxID=3072323 RepID=A0ABU4ZU40_9HYPH|nr:hypothetical protein [Mesorhizobium sp. MSK_1335]MDX8528933.1 hypothetical protein [Mesorhizobium sp. MSK_1335]
MYSNRHYLQIIRHYETAISIQDGMVERCRKRGLPIESDEAFLARLREGLNAVYRVLGRKENRRYISS